MRNEILKAVIVEDEPESLLLLNNLIMVNGLAEVAGSTHDPDRALGLILEFKPDILFLDIQMPGKSGFEVLDDLRKTRSVNPYVVFTTAYNEYAIKAFEYAAFDYLLKPVEPRRLNDTIIRCAEAKSSGRIQKADLLLETYNKLMFRNISGAVFLDPAEVIYIEAEGNYSVFHFSKNRTETVTVLLGKLAGELERENFYRISRSFLINLNYLKKINTKQLQCVLVKNDTEYKCSISREKISDLIALMKNR